MDESKPLEIVVRPRKRLLDAAFVTNARHVLSANDRFTVEVTNEGLLIRCLWYPDLDLAADLLDRHSFEDLLWSEPHIKFKRETVILNGGRRKEIILEPLLLVQVETPAERVGNVIGDLFTRRALLAQQREIEGGHFLISAEVPLSELRRYADDLATLTERRGVASASFLKYGERPGYVGPPPDEPMSAALRA